MMREYTCFMCGRLCQYDITEEELQRQYVEEFGVLNAELDEAVEICDDCYQKIDPAKFRQTVEETKRELLKKKAN
jgi:predicted RNA-binding protein